jgi:hypothetical protein
MPVLKAYNAGICLELYRFHENFIFLFRVKDVNRLLF